jgi:hypothetical protein
MVKYVVIQYKDITIVNSQGNFNGLHPSETFSLTVELLDSLRGVSGLWQHQEALCHRYLHNTVT